MATLHDFRRSLDLSHRSSAQWFWRNFHAQAFIGFESMEFVRDRDLQHRGVDRIIRVEGGMVAYVEEKLQGEKYPNNVFLETISNDVRQTPGWMVKPSAAHFLAYLYEGSWVGYLWSWPAVRLAWAKHGEGWVKRFKLRPAYNDGYKTFGVPVPLADFVKAVEGGQCIDCVSSDGLPFDCAREDPANIEF